MINYQKIISLSFFVPILFLFSQSLKAQSDFFGIIYDSQTKYPIKSDIESINEFIYELQIGHEAEPDTLISIEGEEHKYILKEHTIHEYISKDSIRITGYDKNGDLSFVGEKKYYSDGLLASEEMDFKVPYMEPLSFSKVYKYTDDGKLLSVFNLICDTCEINDKFSVLYDSLGLIKEVVIQKPEIGIVVHSRKFRGDTMRYIAHYTLTDKYKQNLFRYGGSVEDLTLEYIDVFPNEENNLVYEGIRIDKESGLPQTNWIYIRNSNNEIVEFVHFKEGRQIQRRKFELNELGNVKSYVNINISGKEEKYDNILTEDGKYLMKRVKKGTFNYSYDNEGNWINFDDKPYGVNYYRTFTVRKIKYKL